jgi:hypothetical protein
MSPEEQCRLYYAALARAPHYGESREIRALRDYTHAEMVAGRIAGDTQDRIGQLIDALSAQNMSRVGAVIGPGASGIAWDVLQVRDRDGDVWMRAFGTNRYAVEDFTGQLDVSQEYDWFTKGGWATTDGLLQHAPLTVIVVAQLP